MHYDLRYGYENLHSFSFAISAIDVFVQWQMTWVQVVWVDGFYSYQTNGEEETRVSILSLL
jgi:hypothetical protein